MRSVYADLPDSARYAGLWIRVFANVLDVLALAALNAVVALSVDGWETGHLPGGVGSISGVHPGPVIFALVFPPVAIICCWIALGASPGKMMLGLRIVDEPTGGRLTPWQCVGRYMMGLLVVALAGVGYVYLVIDPRKQGWHDKIVRTLVVRRGPTA